MNTDKPIATTAERVDAVLRDCLFTEEEIKASEGKMPPGTVVAQGIVNTFGLHPERLESHRAEIIEFINILHSNFRPTTEDGGGGWSFLNLPFTASGDQWGEQWNAEQLLALASAIGHAKILTPRDAWPIFPGGVPYVLFSKEKLQ